MVPARRPADGHSVAIRVVGSENTQIVKALADECSGGVGVDLSSRRHPVASVTESADRRWSALWSGSRLVEDEAVEGMVGRDRDPLAEPSTLGVGKAEQRSGRLEPGPDRQAV